MKIIEIPNNKYKINPIKMANDCKIEGMDEPMPNYYNFFMLLIGKPNSGKSTWWLNFINRRSHNTFYKKFDKIFIFSNSLRTITQKIKLPEDRLFDGIQHLESVINDIKESEDKVLIIIDDCITDINDTSYMQRLIFNRRHLAGGISLLITTQVYNKLKLSLRKCASDLVLWSTTNKKELNSIYEDYINIPKEDFLELCRYCFKKDNHQFLWVKNDENQFYHNFNKIQIYDE